MSALTGSTLRTVPYQLLVGQSQVFLGELQNFGPSIISRCYFGLVTSLTFGTVFRLFTLHFAWIVALARLKVFANLSVVSDVKNRYMCKACGQTMTFSI